MTIADKKGPGKAIFAQFRGQIERCLERVPGHYLVTTALILASTGSFGLGVIAGRESRGGNERVAIEAPQVSAAAVLATSTSEGVPTPAKPAASTGVYVASKTGTKYYLPSCGTAKRIKDENKVWFQTKEEAEAKGYEPGKNCKGL